jgi:hypothetical protein
MGRQWSKVAWGGFALIAILAVGLLIYGLLSPAGRAAIDHYQCLKREEPKAAAVAELIERTLEEGRATKTNVRQFLDQNFADLPIFESQAEMSAGHMWFSFDERGFLTAHFVEIPCLIL